MSVTQPANGEVVINDDGTLEYTPNTDFIGRDPFTYTICDPPCGECIRPCAEAQVTVTVSDITASEYNGHLSNDDFCSCHLHYFHVSVYSSIACLLLLIRG